MQKSIPYILFITGFLILIQVGCQKELFCPDCSGNQPPVANAGIDTIVLIPEIIRLDGTKSTDADGAIIDFKWKKINGPDPILISNDTLPLTSVKNLKKGIYLFELTVTDNLGLQDKDTVQIIASDVNSSGRPPVAKAGSDSVIAQLSSGVILDGSNSTDPDNDIASYEWIQISTRPVASVSTPSGSISLVTFVGNGNYSFMLKVTDSTGLADTDTITFTIQDVADNFCSGLTRTNINATTSSVGKLSVPRRLGAVAAAGNKIVFAGGYPDFDDNPLATVDIYDINNGQWTKSSLSSPRVSMATIVSGEKIYFAGGIDYELDMATGTIYSDIDIYNSSTNSWSSNHLSAPRMGLTSASVGGKLYFAGGATTFTGQSASGNQMSDIVDIYSPASDTWEKDQLSEARYDLKANVASDKIYFAGGSSGQLSYSSKVDILDQLPRSWSLGDLHQPRVNFNSISFDNKIMWACGYTLRNGSAEISASVEIFDAVSGTTDLHCLNNPTAWLLGHNGIVKWKNWIVIFPDLVYKPRIFEIYNTDTRTWFLGVLDREIYWPTVVVAQDKLYVADGASGQVWNVNF